MKKIWIYETIQKEALKYSNKKDFKKYSSGAYQAAKRMKILKQVCSHMTSFYHNWTDEELALEALKYKTRLEFQIKSSKAYNAAYRRNVLDKICSHMSQYDKKGESNPNFKWADDKLKKEALEYNTRKEFELGNPNAYSAAQRRGILDKICAHMEWGNYPWTNKELALEALKYKTRLEFLENNQNAYQTAFRRGILDQICFHMKLSRNTSKPEQELFDILKEFFPNLIKKTFSVNIPSKPHIHRFQIDILDPNTKLGIEYDGQYHHSKDYLIKTKTRIGWSIEDSINYHEIKDSSLWNCHNIKLLHIKGEDWKKDKQVCIDNCLKFLNTTEKKTT